MSKLSELIRQAHDAAIANGEKVYIVSKLEETINSIPEPQVIVTYDEGKMTEELWDFLTNS